MQRGEMQGEGEDLSSKELGVREESATVRGKDKERENERRILQGCAEAPPKPSADL